MFSPPQNIFLLPKFLSIASILPPPRVTRSHRPPPCYATVLMASASVRIDKRNETDRRIENTTI